MPTPSTAFAEPREPPNLARHKLDRLRELRAVIDSLQREREPRDPLLTWIVERDTTGNH